MSESEHAAEQVSIRQRWPHEALDFTPWLACNLHLLGNVLDLDLKLIQTEYPVGSFSLDVLAKEVKSGVKVAIENQYSGRSFSRINVRSDGSIDDPPEKLEEIRAWMLDMLPKLKKIFDPRLEKIPSELRVGDDDDGTT